MRISSMAQRSRRPNLASQDIGVEEFSSRQTAQYTRELLDSLGKIAAKHEQALLARLLEAAAIEAARIAESTKRLER
jgi:hypothetical protein